MVQPAPHFSIVIPIHNEAAILNVAIRALLGELEHFAQSYEVVLSENGSTDGTRFIARELQQAHHGVDLVTSDSANYGLGLRRGIERARGSYVLCEEIDLLDTAFHRQALAMLEQDQADLVIGSKLAQGARDERPWSRHAASVVYTTLLRTLLGFRGTDTHGLKAMRREAILPVVRACRVDKDVFASELVIRAQRAGLRLVEVPTRIREKRPPSVDLYKRVPSVLMNLARLAWSIHSSTSDTPPAEAPATDGPGPQHSE